MNSLVTERLNLRPFTINDIDLLYPLHSNAEVMQFIFSGVMSREEAYQGLQEDILHEEKYGFSKWAVFLKDTNEFIGRAGWAKWGSNNEVEVGFKFFPQYWNQGFASEVLQALITWGKIHLSFKMIAFAFVENKASFHVIEKSGMHYLRQDEYQTKQIVIYTI